MELQIRPAQADDALAISQLLQGLAHHFLLDPTQAATSPFMQTVSPAAIAGYISSDFFDYCVGEVQGQLAGAVAVRDGKHLFHLFVDTPYQRQGLAARLWAHAQQRAWAKGNSQGFTVNSTPFAVPAYQRLGFVATGPEVQTRGVAYVPMRLGSEGFA
jgi:GNAT superfamily N-acetyltransferase